MGWGGSRCAARAEAGTTQAGGRVIMRDKRSEGCEGRMKGKSGTVGR